MKKDNLLLYLQKKKTVKKMNKVAYNKVREIKTGRVFLAEYSSEAAEWYEKETGNAYSISDVEIVKERRKNNG